MEGYDCTTHIEFIKFLALSAEAHNLKVVGSNAAKGACPAFSLFRNRTVGLGINQVCDLRRAFGVEPVYGVLQHAVGVSDTFMLA